MDFGNEFLSDLCFRCHGVMQVWFDLEAFVV